MKINKTTKRRTIIIATAIILSILTLMTYQVIASAHAFEDHMRAQKFVSDTLHSDTTVLIPIENEAEITDITTDTATNTTTDAIVDTTTDDTTDTIAEPIVEYEQPETIISEEYNYSDYEVDLLGRVVFCEANIYTDDDGIVYECSDTWQQYVANVIINRINSDLFPYANSIEDVVYADGQYDSSDAIWKVDTYTREYQRAYENAKLVLDGYRPLPENVIYQAEFEQGSGVFAHIGNTYFCYA